VCTVKAERWIKAFPQLWKVHMNGLTMVSNLEMDSTLPFIGVNTEVAGEVTLASKSPVAIGVLANKGANHEVMSGADLIGVIDQLKAKSIVFRAWNVGCSEGRRVEMMGVVGETVMWFAEERQIPPWWNRSHSGV
jgi:hypothetical protein